MTSRLIARRVLIYAATLVDIRVNILTRFTNSPQYTFFFDILRYFNQAKKLDAKKKKKYSIFSQDDATGMTKWAGFPDMIP